MNVEVSYNNEAQHTIQPPVEIDLPLSKSVCNRTLILDAIAGVETPVAAIARCDDSQAIVKALKEVRLARPGEICHVNIGAAGTAMRFLTALFAATDGVTVEIDGSERMRHRPIGILVESLQALGADIHYIGEDGYPPLHISGKRLHGGKIKLDGSVSSQFVSALMMIGPTLSSPLNIWMEGDIVSTPYISMTLSMLRTRGINCIMDKSAKAVSITTSPGTVSVHGGLTEHDWSAASYWYETVALTHRPVILKGLSRQSLQGDAATARFFEQLGVVSESSPRGIILYYKDPSTVRTTATESVQMVGPAKEISQEELRLDLNENPDLAQTLIATCCGIGRPAIITGLSTLRNKETDRLAAMTHELGRLGYNVKSNGIDTLQFNGQAQRIAGALAIETYKDHRMAMSIAPLAAAACPLTIKDATVVAKSYPDFWKELRRVGYFVTDFT